MRTEIKVLWFDDDDESDSVKIIKQKCINFFNAKGYKCTIEDFYNYDEAIERLQKHERIDLIFTDFNVESNSNDQVKNGLKFLLKARSAQLFKQLIVLYSSDEETNIKEEIKKALDENELSDFS